MATTAAFVADVNARAVAMQTQIEELNTTVVALTLALADTQTTAASNALGLDISWLIVCGEFPRQQKKACSSQRGSHQDLAACLCQQARVYHYSPLQQDQGVEAPLHFRHVALPAG